MYNWDEIQRRIFATESGGDYNALYNYQNRPDGRFSDVQLTEMPISDVLSFTNPQGEYASYVRSQVGRTATPVGAYQVVGSTLRNAVEALGIDPSTPFNQETQDRIGRWILENQGPQAWEGLTRGGNMNGLLGGGPVTASSMNPQQPEQNRFFNADTRDRLIMALQGMTLNPNQALIQTAAQGIQQRAAQRQTTEERNATAEWLQQNGMGQYADAVRRGLMTGAEAFNIARTESETATQRETESSQRAAAAEWLRTSGGPQGARFADLVERGIISLEDAMGQIESPDPQSAIAKLAADRRNNLITEEEYQVGLQNLTPSGMSIETTPDGGVRLVQGPGAGSSGAGLNVTESQTLGFAIRAEGALQDLEPVANTLADPLMRAVELDPTGTVRGNVQSEDYQVARNAADEFLQAILRKDTGAAITPQEQELYGRTYLPQAGDSEAVLQQKARARQRAVAALRAGMTPDMMLRLEGVNIPTEAGSSADLSDDDLINMYGGQ